MTDEASPGSSVRGSTSSVADSIGARRWFRVAVAVAASPILIAAVRNGLNGWIPTGDAALVSVWIRDVFSAHPPLIGLPAYPSMSTAHPYNFPGPISLYLLAVPVRLLGDRWGVLIGMGVLNTAWFCTAMWLLRRRVGYRAGLVGCVFAASLVWSLGSQLLVDYTPLQVGIIPFFVCLVAAWSVAEGDHRGLLPLAVAANFLVLTQLKFVLVVPLLCAVSLLAYVLRRRRPTAESSATRSDRRAGSRALVASGVITMIAWIPPLVHQAFSADGNLGNLLASATSLGGSGSLVPVGYLDALGATSSTIITLPLWFRGSIAHPNFDSAGPTFSVATGVVGALVVGGIIAWVLVTARMRKDRSLVTGLGVSAVAWAAWTVSTVLNPNAFGIAYGYLFAIWPLAMFTWFLLTLGVYRSVPARRLLDLVPSRNAVPSMAVGVVVLFAVLTVPIANLGAQTPQQNGPVAREVDAAVRSLAPSDGPVLVRTTGGTLRMFPVVVLALRDNGIRVKVESGWTARQFRSHRTYRADPPNATSEVLVSFVELPRKKGRELIRRPRFTSFQIATNRRLAACRDRVTSAGSDRAVPDTGVGRHFVDQMKRGDDQGLRIENDFLLASWLRNQDSVGLQAAARTCGLTSAALDDWADAHYWAMLNGGWIYLEKLGTDA